MLLNPVLDRVDQHEDKNNFRLDQLHGAAYKDGILILLIHQAATKPGQCLNNSNDDKPTNGR